MAKNKLPYVGADGFFMAAILYPKLQWVISPLQVTGMGTIGLLDSVRLSVCLSVRLSVCLSVRPSVCHAFRVRTISPTPVGQILYNFT